MIFQGRIKRTERELLQAPESGTRTLLDSFLLSLKLLAGFPESLDDALERGEWIRRAGRLPETVRDESHCASTSARPEPSGESPFLHCFVTFKPHIIYYHVSAFLSYIQ